jgi:hypothetical protein
MSDVPTLLPSSAGRLERALEQAAVTPPIAIADIRKLWDPEDVPPAFLPWLAWAFDVPAWPTGEAERRAVVAGAVRSHRIMGTLGSFRELARFAGSELLRATTPPAKTFCGVAMTEAERDAFLARMPYVMIYPFRHEGVSRSMFVGDLVGGPRSYMADTGAILRIGDALELVDPDTGLVTPLNNVDLDRLREARLGHVALDVRLKGLARGVFLGEAPRRPWLVDQNAAGRFYRLTLDAPYVTDDERWSMLSIRPSLQPATGTYEEVRIAGTAYGVFLGDRPRLRYLVRSEAGLRIAKRLRLYDPDRAVAQARRKTSLFLGQRIGRMPAHRAEIAIDMRSPTPPGKAFGRGFINRLFPVPSTADQRITKVRRSLLWGKRASDDVRLQINPYLVVPVSTATRLGRYKVGEYIPEAI